MIPAELHFRVCADLGFWGRTIVLEAVTQTGLAFQYAAEVLRSDGAFVLEIARQAVYGESAPAFAMITIPNLCKYLLANSSIALDWDLSTRG
jgi:hypothetical protein